MSVKKNKRFNVKVKRFSINSLALTVQKLLARLKFSKNWVKLQSQGHSVKNNDTHGKVLSQGIFMWNIKALALTCSIVISKFKVVKKWVKLQAQGHRVKNNGTHGKVLSQGISMWNIKALALTVQKLLARLKLSKNGSNSKVKVTVSKIMVHVPTERSYHRKYSCDISKL